MHKEEILRQKYGIRDGILSEKPVWVKFSPCVGYIKGNFYAIGLSLNQPGVEGGTAPQENVHTDGVQSKCGGGPA